MSSLPAAYSQKAQFLEGVHPDASLYAPSKGTMTPSRVSPPTPFDYTESAIAFTSVDNGWLAYVGDVNNEEGSERVVTDLCKFACERAGMQW
jgi:hypothetical protein